MYNALTVLTLYCKTLVLLLGWIRVRLGQGLVVWVGLRWVNSVITEINYRCNYIQVFLYVNTT